MDYPKGKERTAKGARMPEPPTDSNDENTDVISMPQLLEYIQQMKKQMKELERKASLTPQPDKIDLPKPAKPSTFGGKSGESIDTWIFSIEQYFKLMQAPTDTRILLAASYLVDNAATWWRYVSIENERKNVTWSWNDFVEGLRTQFRPISAEKVARNRLNTLRQTASVASYTNTFRNLMIEVPTMAEEDKLEYYLKGLKNDIHERVALQIPKSLAEACNMAQAIDNIRFQIRIQNATRYTQPTTSDLIRTTPMEIDTIRKGKLTEQEREHLRKIGGCFFCREIGHLSRNCPKKKRINAVETQEPEDLSGKEQAQ